MVAVPAGTRREIVHPQGWKRSPNPYSYAIRSGDTLFLAGLVSRKGADNAFVAGDVRVQTRTIMENARELLEAAGMTLANIVSARVYLTNAADFAAMNEVYAEYFPSAPPARATVQCGLAGPEAVVEITFIASAAPRAAIGMPPSGLPISPAVKSGSRVYVSGMLGNTPATAGDVAAQTRETLAKIGRTLADAGAGPADVVEGLVYLTEPAAFPLMNKEYREFFGKDFPGESDRRGAAGGARRTRRDHDDGSCAEIRDDGRERCVSEAGRAAAYRNLGMPPRRRGALRRRAQARSLPHRCSRTPRRMDSCVSGGRGRHGHAARDAAARARRQRSGAHGDDPHGRRSHRRDGALVGAASR